MLELLETLFIELLPPYIIPLFIIFCTLEFWLIFIPYWEPFINPLLTIFVTVDSSLPKSKIPIPETLSEAVALIIPLFFISSTLEFWYINIPLIKADEEPPLPIERTLINPLLVTIFKLASPVIPNPGAESNAPCWLLLL